MAFKTALAAAVSLYTLAHAAVEPADVYNGGFSFDSNDTIKLRIANGGAGQSGLIGELANAYIKDKVAAGSEPFQVAWIRSDTHYSIEYLDTKDADVGITYNLAAEKFAIAKGIAKDPWYYVFRDHFLLVGPESNPANISKDDDIDTIMNQLYEAAEGEPKEPPVRFLSRYDKSATNIKESLLWAGIGQVPWATAYSTWYHQYIAFPIQALTAAILLNEYTLTDRGTILSLDANMREKTVVYKAGSDSEDDLLLNPAHLLIGTKAPNAEQAEDFTEWVTGKRGQDVIKGFKKDGEILYTGAPEKQEKVRTYLQ